MKHSNRLFNERYKIESEQDISCPPVRLFAENNWNNSIRIWLFGLVEKYRSESQEYQNLIRGDKTFHNNNIP